MFKHGNLIQDMHVDPARDIVGVVFSACPVDGAPDTLPGYIRQTAKNQVNK